MTVLTVCPSYGRPDAAEAVLESFHKTKGRDDSFLMFLLAHNDEKLPDYATFLEGNMAIICPDTDMVPRCNNAIQSFLGNPESLIHEFSTIGWIADDNRFQTDGWDEMVQKAIEDTPVVFGNDVVSPGSKPSHVFLDIRIPRTLGWFLLPGVHSTFFDDAWANLGVGPIDVSGPLFSQDAIKEVRVTDAGLGITYLGEMKIEHLYQEKNNATYFAKDLEVYRKWLRHDSEDDIARTRRALRSGRNAARSRTSALPSTQ